MTASVVLSGIILFFIYGYRKERGVSYLIGVIVCRMIYSSSIIMEKSSYLLTDKLFFRHIQSTALNLMVPFILLFVYHLVGREKLIKLRWKVMLFSIFVLWSLLSWFDFELHVIYHSVDLVDGHLATARTVYSISFSLVCCGIIAACLYFLFQYVRNIRNDFRKPGMWVLFLSTFPFVLEIAKLMEPDWSSWLLPLSVYCGFTGTLMLVITLRIKFFAILPFARTIVLDTLQESVVITNASGKIIDSNKRASQWFAQMGHAAISGRDVRELLEPWPEWHQLCESMKEGRVEVEAWLDGERKIYSVHVSPVYRLRTQGSVSLIVDITEKEKHLEQIAHLNRLKDQLFTIVSHDIRSPLASQYQLIAMLEEDRDRLDEEHREIIGMLGEQIRQTLGMTNNLLEWFRSQREDMALRPQWLELSDVAEECCHVLYSQSAAKRISVESAVPVGTRVYADREALGLILRNLLSNAIKFTEAEGAVCVDAKVSGEWATISVRDNGIGMEEEHVMRLFEEPLNSSPGTSGEKGSGLGLLVSRQFVERSGGKLWAESRPGQGSVFHFTMRSGTDG
ncbi:phospho-acceptor domain-containing protein [Cohnella sp. SGD-V74]|uniref:sensor histidine kinase n=1 Tax=unclassified Cohnella TaxID=2636738 RepID=UPI000D4895B2|nr:MULTISPECIES: ATP-binding protein [unclassified Cohnella]PRX60173.1 phospho-acceptor domain-containing protein [Cohnella sp. SGD-V74]